MSANCTNNPVMTKRNLQALSRTASIAWMLKAKLEEIVLDGHGRLDDSAMFLNSDKQETFEGLKNKTPSDVRCQVLCLVGDRDLPRFHAVADHFAKTIPRISVAKVSDAGGRIWRTWKAPASSWIRSTASWSIDVESYMAGTDGDILEPAFLGCNLHILFSVHSFISELWQAKV